MHSGREATACRRPERTLARRHSRAQGCRDIAYHCITPRASADHRNYRPARDRFMISGPVAARSGISVPGSGISDAAIEGVHGLHIGGFTGRLQPHGISAEGVKEQFGRFPRQDHGAVAFLMRNGAPAVRRRERDGNR